MKVLSESLTKSRESLCTEFRLNVKSKYEQLDDFRKRVTDFMICHFRCDVGTSS